MLQRCVNGILTHFIDCNGLVLESTPLTSTLYQHKGLQVSVVEEALVEQQL